MACFKAKLKMNGSQALFHIILNTKCMKWFTYTDFTIASILKTLINLVASVDHTFSDNVVQYSTIQIP